jgi:protoporphyrinogen/coproporphyrinogen III oxidase
MTGPLRIVVVGGGITGLAAAHALSQEAIHSPGRSLAITLVESALTLGGKVRTERVGRMLFECGPDAMFLRDQSVVDYCQTLGLGEDVVAADPRHRQSYILWRGRLHEIPSGMEGGVPRSVRPLARSGLLSPWGKARAAMEVAVPARREERDESVDGFIRRRFGAEVAERIAAPLLGGIYNNDPRRLSLLATLPHLREAERRHRSLLVAAWRRTRATNGKSPAASRAVSPFVSLRGGLASLPDALARRLDSVQVRLGTSISAIRAGGHDGARFGLDIEGDESLPADRVILTIPAFAAADVLQGLSPAAATHLREIRYASTVVVALAFPATVGQRIPTGSGFLVAPDEKRWLSACSWTSRKWPHCTPDGEILIRCHIKVEVWPDAMTASDDTLVAAALTEMRDLLGIVDQPITTRVYRWPRSLPSYQVGHLDRLAAIKRALAETPGLFIAGAGYGGAGLPACIKQGLDAAKGSLLNE